MKIVMLEGSPHRYGSSNCLAAEFTRGAAEAGHQVEEFKVAQMVIQPCFGCEHCRKDGPCFYDDDMSLSIRPALLGADMVVFVTPIYYLLMPAQLKAVIDRFYSFAPRLAAKHMKSALIACASSESEGVMSNMSSYYASLCELMDFEDRGRVLGLGCATPEATRSSRYMRDAYDLGASIS